jgi:hypothetical protein
MSGSVGVRDGAQAPTGAVRSRLDAVVAPEERLLLLSAGGVANDDAMRSLASDGVDWQRFVGLAQFERAVPVVYPRLRAVAADTVPDEVLEQMRRLAMVSDFAMLHLEGRMRESLRALEAADVRVMLLKGAALAQSAYSGFRQRPMSDLDVLVDPSNAHLTRRLMLGAGWCDIVGGIPAHVYERHHHLPPLHDTRSPDLQLEIHTGLFPLRQPFAFDAAEMWRCARSLGPAFPNAFVPDAVHALLHACLHFVWSHQARFGVWRTIRDVDALIRTNAIDWDSFVSSAQAARGGTSCYWTFRIVELAAGVAVPTTVVDQLRPPRSAYMLQTIEQHFMRNLFPVEFACPSVTLDHALWELAVMPGWSGHGEIRPWDDEAAFVMPGEAPTAPRTSSRERIRRFLASPGYIRTLLRSRG